jgi:radical SAM protein with 4Fe4S-binding SPASM domain
MLREIFLEKKRDPEQEYTLHLFEFCNLRCQFCWQDHENRSGLDNILEKLEPIEEFLKEESRESVVFNIMGGEIFADEIFDDGMLHTYRELTLGIKNLTDKYEKKVKINWVSNLVTSKYKSIEALLKFCKFIEVPAVLVTSYDPRGRFNINEFQNYKHTLAHFKDDVKCFSMLMTRPNMEYLMEGKDPFFKELYHAGKYIYFDYYSPDESAEHNAPSEVLLLKFFKFLIDNYPKCDPVRSWIENDKNYLSCRTSKLVLADGTKCGCGNLMQGEKVKELYETDIQPLDNQEIEINFITKYNCTSCEYLYRCGMGCFMSHDYKFKGEILDECVYKLTHKHIDDVCVRLPTQPIVNQGQST